MTDSGATFQSRTLRFAAFRNPHYRTYVTTACLAMAADNVEHVLGYWIIWELTHSPFWVGYAVVSHWLPFTLFSLFAGGLADRFSKRWLIQVSQVLYVGCSLTWGILWLTGQLQIWHVAIILVVHGFAGVFYEPSALVIIHDLIGDRDLMSGLSFHVSARQAASMIGPVVGGTLLATVGAGPGFLINVAIYVPLSIAIMRLPIQPPRRSAGTRRGWQTMAEGLRLVGREPRIVGILVLTAVPSFLISVSLPAMMPAFAEGLAGSARVALAPIFGGVIAGPELDKIAYSVLLAGNGTGAVLGAIVLGFLGARQAYGRVALASSLAWAFSLALFAASPWFLVSLALLLAAGMSQIIFVSTGQTLVQAWAPPEHRGSVIGVLIFSSAGMRVGSGLTMGLLATLLGAPAAVLIAAAIIGLATLLVAARVPALR